MFLGISQVEERNGRVRHVVGLEAAVLDEEPVAGARLSQQAVQVVLGHLAVFGGGHDDVGKCVRVWTELWKEEENRYESTSTYYINANYVTLNRNAGNFIRNLLYVCRL